MDKVKQSIDQNVLARKSNKNQVKNATNVDEERLMKNKSWNESPSISKESQISDRKVVTRKHHKRIAHVRQDITKEQHMMKRRTPNESFTNRNDCFNGDQKVEKKHHQTSQNSSKTSNIWNIKGWWKTGWNESSTISQEFQIIIRR